jgi:cob(I)alamin adenosyltransferase
MSTKIYTKTGDKGTTGLFGGARLSKAHYRIEAYGTLDELNSVIGMLRDYLDSNHDQQELLQEIQERLFSIGADLATDPEKKSWTLDLTESDVQSLEKNMDKMTDVLPELKHFILPGGGLPISAAHLARTVCRRAERRVVGLMESSVEVDELIIRYLNRLSDYFFVLGRKIAQDLGKEEVKWLGRKK